MILATGLSPAWQQILRFDRLRIGEVNRALDVHACASGKVLNVAVALHHLGAEALTVSTIGGASGRGIEREFAAAGMTAAWIETEVPARVCTTILNESTGTTTELVENTRSIGDESLRQYTTTLRQAAASADVIVISGSMPAETPATLWRDVLAGSQCPAICDFRGAELLAALDARPFLIKPNREELAATLGSELKSGRQLDKAMRELNDRGAEWVVVTDGRRDVRMTSRNEAYRFSVPKVNVVNPIGCGDCLAAGIAAGLQRGLSTIACVQYGIAAAAENARQLLPARIDPDAVGSLAKRVTVKKTPP